MLLQGVVWKRREIALARAAAASQSVWGLGAGWLLGACLLVVPQG